MDQNGKTKKTKNYSKLTMFILRDYFGPLSYKVNFDMICLTINYHLINEIALYIRFLNSMYYCLYIQNFS